MMGRWTFLWMVVLFLSLGLQQRGLAEERYTVKPGDTLYSIPDLPEGSGRGFIQN